MIRVPLLLVTLAGLVSVANAFESVDDSSQWAMTGLSIVDVETGEITPNQAILIQNGVIRAVGDALSVLPESDLLVVDHRGRYVIPGLWDMHVHLRGGPRLIDSNERWLQQYLGFGITAVRDAGGDLANSVLHWKAEVAEGYLLGPRIFSALRKIDGAGDRQSGSIPVDSSGAIDKALDNLEFAGADFVKIYDFSLPRKLHLLAVSKSESRGLRTSAHIPPRVSIEDAINAGLDSIEHSFYLVKAANPDDRRLAKLFEVGDRADYVAYFRNLAAIGDDVDLQEAHRVFRLMVRKGTAVVSTLEIERLTLDYLSGAPIDDPRRDETPKLILDTHDRSKEFLTSFADELLPAERKIVQQTRRLLKIASDDGVMILAGSDTGTNNLFLYPGDSLHAEMEAMVDIGMSPLQALQSATTNPARWMRLHESFGSISPGFVADLVILESSPLSDISNTRTIVGAVQQGVYFDGGKLEELRQLPRVKASK